MNRKSCTIVYGLFYGNIRCTKIFGTLWRMRRQCVPGPLFGPGDEAKCVCTSVSSPRPFPAFNVAH